MAIRKFHIEFLDGTPFSPSQVVSPSRVWDYQSSLVTLGTMTSADFLPYLYRVRISPGKSLFFHLIPAASTDGSLLVKALCKDVLAYPLLTASVCRSCSSVPDFVVSLSSVLQLLTATLRLTNRLHQLACKGLPPSRIIHYLAIVEPILGAHNVYVFMSGKSPPRHIHTSVIYDS